MNSVLAAIALLFLASPALGAWWTTEPAALARSSEAGTLAAAFRTYGLDRAAFDVAAAGVPLAGSGSAGVEFALPGPDGEAVRFLVVEDPILGDDLVLRRPDVRTYRGVGIEDPRVRVRFAVMEGGVSAVISSPTDPWYLETLPNSVDGAFIAYRERDRWVQPFECKTESVVRDQIDDLAARLDRRTSEVVRTYDIAFSVTGEFTVASGGATAVENTVIALVNRLTGLFMNDFTVRFRLVAVEAYSDPATDPFEFGEQLGEIVGLNTWLLDQIIGSSNYDIGHVLGFSPDNPQGGLAAVGATCSVFQGAGGTLLSTVSAGGLYDVFLHEIGHQMGADHSFNGSTSFCGPQRAENWAYEIGSGVTIMGYAGLCGAESVVRSRLQFFNAGSIAQISALLDSTNCAEISPTTNTRPVVPALPDVTIPRSTAFVLGSDATDPDGDALTFAWEQYDLGAASPPVGPATGPLFRNFEPSPSSTRSFPFYSSYRRNILTPWEFLPAADRTMRFRVMVRDNRSDGGAIGFAEQRVVVSGAPFRVLAPGAGESGSGGSDIVVTWDAGGSTDSDVRILVSTDDAVTFDELVASTPNDGEATVRLPCAVTSEARIRVEGTVNPWFDLSDQAFTIEADAIAPAVDCPAAVTLTAPSSLGLPSDDPSVQAFFDAVSVTDNCGEPLEPVLLLPPVLPIGVTTAVVTATDAAGNLGFCLSTVTVVLGSATDVPASLVRRTGFESVAPNPFNPRTSIEYTLARAQSVRLEVFDVRGRRVDTLVDGSSDAGRHRVVWNGTNARGDEVPTGVYLFRLHTEEGNFSERAVLLK